jgi:hypothetical protein
VFDLEKLDLDSLGLGPTHYEEIFVAFLPEQRELLEIALRRFEAAAKKRPGFVARREDFEKVFDTLIRVKAKKTVWNTALALAQMAELAAERLDQIELEERSQTADPNREKPKIEAIVAPKPVAPAGVGIAMPGDAALNVALPR